MNFSCTCLPVKVGRFFIEIMKVVKESKDLFHVYVKKSDVWLKRAEVWQLISALIKSLL